MSDLLELAARCEAATGPDRLLDGEIAKALSPEREWHLFDDTWGARCPDDGVAFDMPDEFSRSLDAAMTLIDDRDAADFSLNKSSMSVDMGGKDWRCQVGRRRRASGRTPALAVAAAALRARSEAAAVGGR